MCITLFSTFLWRPQQDYDEKFPNVTFYGGREQTTANFPFSTVQIDVIKFKRTEIIFLATFHFTAVVVAVA